MKITEKMLCEAIAGALKEYMDGNGELYPNYIRPNEDFDDDINNDEEMPNLSDLLNDCGWAYSSVSDMPDGRVAYRCVEHSSRPMKWDEVRDNVESVFGERVSFGSATSRYAPEQKFHVVYILTSKKTHK